MSSREASSSCSIRRSVASRRLARAVWTRRPAVALENPSAVAFEPAVCGAREEIGGEGLFGQLHLGPGLPGAIEGVLQRCRRLEPGCATPIPPQI